LEQQSIVYLCQGRKTIIEGVVYYDVEKDKLQKVQIIKRTQLEKIGQYYKTKEKNHCDSEELQ
jgi:hypothetical protein